MKHRTIQALTISALALFAAAGVSAQQPTPKPAPAIAAVPAPDPRGDVDFAGGTLTQYVELIGVVFGSANAVIDPEAALVRVAPVRLQAVTRLDAMQVLDILTTRRVGVFVRGDTYAIFSNQPVAEEGVDETGISVWPLAKTLARMKAEEALSAIQAALELAGEGASVKFHEDTSLLVVRGTEEQIDAVNQVVGGLDNVAGYREGEAEQAERAKAPPPAGLEERVRDLRAEFEELKAQVKLIQAAPRPASPAR